MRIRFPSDYEEGLSYTDSNVYTIKTNKETVLKADYKVNSRDFEITLKESYE